MTQEQIGAIAGICLGIMMGVLAAFLLAHALERLFARAPFPKWHLSGIIGLLGGTTIATAPAGNLLAITSVTQWYIVGEAIVFIPAGLVIFAVYLYQVIKLRPKS